MPDAEATKGPPGTTGGANRHRNRVKRGLAASRRVLPSPPRQLAPGNGPTLLRDKDGQLLLGIQIEQLSLHDDARLTLSGWLIGDFQLSLLRDGLEIRAEIVRTERLDVPQVDSIPTNMHVGFELHSSGAAAGSYILRCLWMNGSCVDFSLPSAWPPTGDEATDRLLFSSNIETVAAFSICGWVVVGSDRPMSLGLMVTGQPVEFSGDMARTEGRRSGNTADERDSRLRMSDFRLPLGTGT